MRRRNGWGGGYERKASKQSTCQSFVVEKRQLEILLQPTCVRSSSNTMCSYAGLRVKWAVVEIKVKPRGLSC